MRQAAWGPRLFASAGTSELPRHGVGLETPLILNESFAVHLSGLFQAHEIQHGGGDVGRAAVPHRFNSVEG